MAFDEEKQEANLETSTFDIVRVSEFHNLHFGTIFSYFWMWMMVIFKIAMLGSDTYTCVNILAFDRWSADDYEIYKFNVAKWIFTGCIGFRFLLLAWQIGWAIHIYRTRNIALAYLNNYARIMYAVRSYDYQCLFHDIELKTSLPWASFLVYFELDNALEVLVADAPREVINILTLKNYATHDDFHDNVLKNIEYIATTNTRLAVILSLVLCSVVIYLFFFFRFSFAILFCYIPVKMKVSRNGFKSVKAFCYAQINERVRLLVLRHHKPKQQLLLEGILDILAINANPLLHSGSSLNLGDETFTHPAFRKMSAFDKASVNGSEVADEYSRPPRAYTRTDSNSSAVDPFEKHPFRTYTSETLMTESSSFSRPTQPAGRVTHEPVMEETASYGSDSRLPLSRSQDSIGSTEQLVTRPADNEPFSRDARHDSADSYENPFIQRRDSDSPFDDRERAPYPVRGVSKYFEGD